jgi:hypothetical protein
MAILDAISFQNQGAAIVATQRVFADGQAQSAPGLRTVKYPELYRRPVG